MKQCCSFYKSGMIGLTLPTDVIVKEENLSHLCSDSSSGLTDETKQKYSALATPCTKKAHHPTALDSSLARNYKMDANYSVLSQMC